MTVALLLVLVTGLSFYYSHSVLHALHLQSTASNGPRSRSSFLSKLKANTANQQSAWANGLAAAPEGTVNNFAAAGAGVAVIGGSPKLPVGNNVHNSDSNHQPNCDDTLSGCNNQWVCGKTAPVQDNQQSQTSSDSSRKQATQVYFLQNRHLSLGLVHDPSQRTLNFFPEMYNFQFSPPMPIHTTSGRTNDLETSDVTAYRPSTFTSVALASDLFTISLNVAFDADHEVDSMRKSMDFRQFPGHEDFFFDPTEKLGGQNLPERAFLPLKMRLRSSKHCRIVPESASDVAYSPVTKTSQGSVGSHMKCKFSAGLRPNPESLDGNGLAKVLPHVRYIASICQ